MYNIFLFFARVGSVQVLESGGKGTLLNNPNAPQPEPSRDNPMASPFDQVKSSLEYEKK